jgi:hypothetical protein
VDDLVTEENSPVTPHESREQSVVRAIRQLRSANQRVSVRTVHALAGGSFRDISRILRESRELLVDDELANLDVDTEVPEPATPALGEIARIVESLKDVQGDIDRAARKLDHTRELLRALHAQRPPPAVDPDDVRDFVVHKRDHEEQVAFLVDEVKQYQNIVWERQGEQRALRAQLTKLQDRAHQLRAYEIPSVRRQIADAQNDLAALERNTAHQLQLMRQHVANQERLLSARERELQGLIGHG